MGNSKDIKAEIIKLRPWFHNLHLEKGIQTEPNHFLGDFPAFKWRKIRKYLPKTLAGWSVLDVGCNGGYYSIELAKMGANVLAIDIDEHCLSQAKWACRHLNLEKKIKFRKMHVYEIVKIRRRFDLVWFMGVFYHLRYPLLALDMLSEKTKKLMVFQTLTMPGDEIFDTPESIKLGEREMMNLSGWPKVAFIEKLLENDPTNWWAPNNAAAQALLRSAGMRITDFPAEEIFICKPEPARSEKRDFAEIDYGTLKKLVRRH